MVENAGRIICDTQYLSSRPWAIAYIDWNLNLVSVQCLPFENSRRLKKWLRRAWLAIDRWLIMIGVGSLVFCKHTSPVTPSLTRFTTQEWMNEQTKMLQDSNGSNKTKYVILWALNKCTLPMCTVRIAACELHGPVSHIAVYCDTSLLEHFEIKNKKK